MLSLQEPLPLYYDSSLHQYYFRALICIATVATLTFFINFASFNPLYVIAAIIIVAYGYGSYHLTHKLPAEESISKNRWLSCADAGLVGLVFGFINFSILPCVLLFIMIQFNALVSGGGRKLVENNVVLIIGVLLSFIFHLPPNMFSTDLLPGIPCLIAMPAYFLVYSVYINRRFHKMALSQKQLESEQKWQKVRAYKLSRYLPPTVWKAINQGKDETLQAERKKISVFFSDIKNFSQLAEEIEAEALTELLNHYLTEMSKIVTQYGGTIDKFMGDSIMVLFGDSNSEGVKEDCIRCVSMALSMKKKMRSLQLEWFNQGIKKPLQIRMGINTGYCTVGTFGTSSHLDYTVLGTQVNLASRLESAAEPDEILISHETWSLCKDTIMCRDKGEIHVKGFTQPIKVYQVADFRKDLGQNQSYFEDRTEGFSMFLDMDKIRNFDKEKVIETLEKAAMRLRDKTIV